MVEQGHDSAGDASLSPVLISLFKGVVYRDERPDLWQSLLRLQVRVRDVASLFGLDLVVNEAEGFAFLRQRESGSDEAPLPRLVARRPLSYPVSLLLALLRKKLAEHDVEGGDPRLILTRDQVIEMMRLFLPDTGDEVRLVGRIDGAINRAVELGFMRRLRGQDERIEVLRILAAFIDAEWLSEFEARLAEYRTYALGEVESSDGA